MSKITDLNQFELLASSSANYTAQVAAASSAAIRELAQHIGLDENSLPMSATTTEPADTDYWFYIEEEN